LIEPLVAAQPGHRVGVVAELAGRQDLHFDRAVGRPLDVLLERQRGGMLGLVGPPRLEVRVLEHLLFGRHEPRAYEQRNHQQYEDSAFPLHDASSFPLGVSA